MCGSPPFQVEFIFEGFTLERTWLETCQSPFVIVPCASVQAFLLGFCCLECWVLGLQLLMSEIWVFCVVIFLLYTSWSSVGHFRRAGCYSGYFGLGSVIIGRFSSSRAKLVVLCSSKGTDSEVEMRHFRSARVKSTHASSTMPRISSVHVV
jgi:hypothetical protein